MVKSDGSITSYSGLQVGNGSPFLIFSAPGQYWYTLLKTNKNGVNVRETIVATVTI